MRDIILAQLAAIRANATAAIASADAVESLVRAWGDIEPDQPSGEPTDWNGVCLHPADKRRSKATHGDRHAWVCLGCGFSGSSEQ